MSVFIKLLKILTFFTTFCDSANILFVIPYILKSHYINLRPIGLELVRRGHNVTVITAIIETNPPHNYTEIFTEHKRIYGAGNKKPNMFLFGEQSITAQNNIIRARYLSFIEETLKATEVKRFLKKNHNFDLVMTEQFYQEAYNYLAYKYNCPLVMMTTYGNCMKQNIVIGNPLQLRVLYSEYLRIYDYGFMSKLMNIYISIYDYINWRYFYLPLQENLAKKYLEIPNDAPTIFSIQKNISLFLMNRHFALDPPVAYFPNFVEIGGVHFAEDGPELTEELKTILDNSQGIVFVSFGSIISISELPENTREKLTKVFRKLNETILINSDVPFEGLSNNMVVSNWFPQRAILSHRKTRLFITHGGLLSMQEAASYGIPVIGIPLFGDQHRNVLNAQELGFGTMVLYKDIENRLEEVILEMLKNDSYFRKAKEIAARLKDRPRQALDTAVSKIEHVIKYGSLLSNIGQDMDWIEFYTVDLFALGVIIVIIFTYLTYKLIKFMKNILLRNKLKYKLP